MQKLRPLEISKDLQARQILSKLHTKKQPATFHKKQNVS